MIAITLCVGFFFMVALVSPVHAAGMWLVIMIIHGLLVESAGETAAHLPLYVGITVSLCILVRGKWSGVQPSVLMLFGTLIFVMGIAALAGIDLGSSLAAISLYAKAFMLSLLLAGCIKSNREVRTITLYCLGGMVCGALAALYQHYTGSYSVNVYDVQRAAGLRGDPNDTAMLLVAGIPLAVYWMLRCNLSLLKGLFAGSLVALVLGIALTGSRGGFLTLLFISLLIYVKKPTFLATISGLVLASILLAFAPQSYWNRMETLLSGKELKTSGSMQHRGELQRKGLSIFLAHPLLGVGPNNFGEAFLGEGRSGRVSVATGRGQSSTEPGLVAHNMYLEFFVENGIFGGLLLLAIFYRSMRGLMRYDQKESHEAGNFGIGNALALALFGMLFSGLFLSQGKNSVLWFLVGIGFATGGLRNSALRAVPHESSGQDHMPEPIGVACAPKQSCI